MKENHIIKEEKKLKKYIFVKNLDVWHCISPTLLDHLLLNFLPFEILYICS